MDLFHEVPDLDLTNHVKTSEYKSEDEYEYVLKFD